MLYNLWRPEMSFCSNKQEHFDSDINVVSVAPVKKDDRSSESFK